ncbi:MAG: response regulator transcription factor [Candidatus Limnocylindria bacterium]
MTDSASDPTLPATDVRILIADDHEVVRIGLASLLDRQPGFSVVGEAGSGQEAVQMARRTRPDVVVMDIRMPHGSGIDACRAITGELPDTPVVMLTSYADSDALFAAIDAGASGYVLKRVGSTELVDAVRTVAAGGSLLDPAVTKSVLDRLRNTSRLEEAGAFADLTEQERRVLSHLADGASNREIAERMKLAEKTVRNYVSSVLAKLALESRAQAAGYAIRNRLPELHEVDT